MIIGWFTRPMQNPASRRILMKEDWLYDTYAFNDDLPYFQQVSGKPFLIVPCTLDKKDTRYRKNQMFTGDDFFCLHDAFDTLYEEGETHPNLISGGLHDRFIARPARSPEVPGPRPPAQRHLARQPQRHRSLLDRQVREVGNK